MNAWLVVVSSARSKNGRHVRDVHDMVNSLGVCFVLLDVWMRLGAAAIVSCADADAERRLVWWDLVGACGCDGRMGGRRKTGETRVCGVLCISGTY